MQPRLPMGEILDDIVAGVTRGGGVSTWVLTIVSLLTLFAAGAAIRLVSRLTRRATPELIVLLNQSAAFYGRWPEDRLPYAPRAELVTEAARCRRIVELLESRSSSDGSGATRGAIDGLQSWISLLAKRIDDHAVAPAGPAFV
jgi:hypothetical protein